MPHETHEEFVHSVMDKVVSAGLVDQIKELVQQQIEDNAPQVTIDGEYESWYITSDPELTTAWEKYTIHPEQPELFEHDEKLSEEVGIPIYKAKISDFDEYS